MFLALFFGLAVVVGFFFFVALLRRIFGPRRSGVGFGAGQSTVAPIIYDSGEPFVGSFSPPVLVIPVPGAPDWDDPNRHHPHSSSGGMDPDCRGEVDVAPSAFDSAPAGSSDCGGSDAGDSSAGGCDGGSSDGGSSGGGD
jgi:hypothetical protein